MAICSGSIMEIMNLGFPEMIFIFLLALIIFGPKKLPEIGRQIGKALNEFKRASNEFKAQIESEISHLDVENHQILPTAEPPAGAVSADSTVMDTATDHELHTEQQNEPQSIAKAQTV